MHFSGRRAHDPRVPRHHFSGGFRGPEAGPEGPDEPTRTSPGASGTLGCASAIPAYHGPPCPGCRGPERWQGLRGGCRAGRPGCQGRAPSAVGRRSPRRLSGGLEGEEESKGTEEGP